MLPVGVAVPCGASPSGPSEDPAPLSNRATPGAALDSLHASPPPPSRKRTDGDPLFGTTDRHMRRRVGSAVMGETAVATGTSPSFTLEDVQTIAMQVRAIQRASHESRLGAMANDPISMRAAFPMSWLDRAPLYVCWGSATGRGGAPIPLTEQMPVLRVGQLRFRPWEKAGVALPSFCIEPHTEAQYLPYALRQPTSARYAALTRHPFVVAIPESVTCTLPIGTYTDISRSAVFDEARAQSAMPLPRILIDDDFLAKLVLLRQPDAPDSPLVTSRHLGVLLLILGPHSPFPRPYMVPLAAAIAMSMRMFCRVAMAHRPGPALWWEFYGQLGMMLKESMTAGTAAPRFLLSPHSESWLPTPPFQPRVSQAEPMPSPAPPYCIIMRAFGDELEEMMDTPPLWIWMEAPMSVCDSCQRAASENSTSSGMTFAAQNLVRYLQAQCGLRWESSPGGGVFGLQLSAAPVLLAYMTPSGSESKECLFGCTASARSIELVREIVAHGIYAAQPTLARVAVVDRIADRVMEAARGSTHHETRISTAAAAAYLRAIADSVRATVVMPERRGLFALRRVDIRAPVARLPAWIDAGSRSDLTPIGAGSRAESANGSSQPAAPAPAWCHRCKMTAPCLHAVRLIATPDERNVTGKAHWDLMRACVDDETREQMDFWMTMVCEYRVALAAEGGMHPVPVMGSELYATAMACMVTARALDLACIPRCPTCGTAYQMDAGCTHIRCSACGDHHCHCCMRRFVDHRQPTTLSSLRAEVQSFLADQLVSRRDGSSPLSVCPIEHPSDVAELFALNPVVEKALADVTEPDAESSQRPLDCGDRFYHALRGSGDQSSFRTTTCPLVPDDVALWDPDDDDMLYDWDDTLFRVPRTNAFDAPRGTARESVVVEIGRRMYLAGAASNNLGEEGRRTAFAYSGALALIRVAFAVRRVTDALEMCPAYAVEKTWPVLMFAGRRWAEAIPDDRARYQAPLSALCMLWLMDRPVISTTGEADNDLADTTESTESTDTETSAGGEPPPGEGAAAEGISAASSAPTSPQGGEPVATAASFSPLMGSAEDSIRNALSLRLRLMSTMHAFRNPSAESSDDVVDRDGVSRDVVLHMKWMGLSQLCPTRRPGLYASMNVVGAL
jgi:hypothetical protein